VNAVARLITETQSEVHVGYERGLSRLTDDVLADCSSEGAVQVYAVTPNIIGGT